MSPRDRLALRARHLREAQHDAEPAVDGELEVELAAAALGDRAAMARPRPEPLRPSGPAPYPP